MELLTTLDAQRRHVLDIVDGLPEKDLRRPILPSGWSCLGLIHHLALDVDRFWFRAVVAGRQDAIDEQATTADAWRVDPDLPAHRVLDRYRQQIALANAVITATPEDAAPAWWPDGLFGGRHPQTHRGVLLHVITETACHAGHLDAARELVDGRQWLVLP